MDIGAEFILGEAVMDLMDVAGAFYPGTGLVIPGALLFALPVRARPKGCYYVALTGIPLSFR